MDIYIVIWMEVQEYLSSREEKIPDTETGIMDLVAEIRDYLFRCNYEAYNTENLTQNILISIISILTRKVHAK